MPALIQPELHRWAKGAIKEVEGNVTPVRTRRRRKLLMVHLDGVPLWALQEAVAGGRMPFLAGLLSSGAYQLDRAFWGSPASTPSFQAGLLYGIRHPNLPAYKWFDRELGRTVRMNAPNDARGVESRLRKLAPNGLLEDGGTTYMSLFKGHADNDFCMTGLVELSTLAQRLFRQTQGVNACARRSRLRFVRDAVRNVWRAGEEVGRWAWHLKDGRHEWQFFLNQLFMIELGWNLANKRALIDMVRGAPAVYLVFGNFDEVAHRRGPGSVQALRHLYEVDQSLAELYAVAKLVREPYDVLFMTDHGHVDSDPFEHRAGASLEKYLLEGRPRALSPELSLDLGRALTDGRAPLPKREPSNAAPRVVDAGNFAHIYLEPSDEPLEALEILSRHRRVLARATHHPDVGVVALRLGGEGVAIIEGSVYRADELERSPLAGIFSKAALNDLLLELPYMPSAGDLVLYGQATHKTGTVGFAWEFGSHGGLTHIETDSVVLWPQDTPLDLRDLHHSTELYEKLSEVYRN